MNDKMPYYMAYPMPFSFDDERTERMDYEYLKSMYPELAKRILPYVEEECDRMEYENSMVYDEYPDKLQLRLMCRRILELVRKYEPDLCACTRGNDAGGMAVQGNRSGKPSCGPDGERIRDLIEVMMYQELYKRRCDYRRKYRRIY